MRVLLTLALIALFATTGWAGEITARHKWTGQHANGNIHVQFEYLDDGKVVLVGNTFYSGDELDIVQDINDAVQNHCNALNWRRNGRPEELKIRKVKTQIVIDAIASQITSITKSAKEVKKTYEGKEITVSADGNVTVTNAP